MIIKCTLDHKFYCADGKPHTVQEILDDNLEIIYEEEGISQSLIEEKSRQENTASIEEDNDGSSKQASGVKYSEENNSKNVLSEDKDERNREKNEIDRTCDKKNYTRKELECNTGEVLPHVMSGLFKDEYSLRETCS